MRWWPISTAWRGGRRADSEHKVEDEARALRPVSLFTHHPAPAPDLAGWRPCGALGDPQYRVLLAHGEGAGRLRRPRYAGARHPVVVGARLRQPRGGIPPHAGARPPR